MATSNSIPIYTSLTDAARSEKLIPADSRKNAPRCDQPAVTCT